MSSETCKSCGSETNTHHNTSMLCSGCYRIRNYECTVIGPADVKYELTFRAFGSMYDAGNMIKGYRGPDNEALFMTKENEIFIARKREGYGYILNEDPAAVVFEIAEQGRGDDDFEAFVDIVRDVMIRRSAADSKSEILHAALISCKDSLREDLKKERSRCDKEAATQWRRIRPALKKLLKEQEVPV